MKELDFKRMIREIDTLVSTDFMFDMDCHDLPKAKPYTQAEAQEMQRVLGKIYSIAHCIDCEACQPKFFL